MEKFQVTLRQYVYYQLEIEAENAQSAMAQVQSGIEDGETEELMTEIDNGELDVIYAIDSTGTLIEKDESGNAPCPV